MALHRQTTLSKQTSQVFQMTLDELQSSVRGSEKLASMNLEEFLSTVWDQQGAAPVFSSEPVFHADALNTSGLHSQHSGTPNDYSGKTVEEVWQAIQAGKGGNDAFESVTLGSFLQSVGVDMPPTVATDHGVSSLHLPPVTQQLQPADALLPGVSHVSHVIPHHSTAVPSNDLRLEDLARPSTGQSLPDAEVHAIATIRMGPGGGQTKSGRPRRKAASPSASPSQEMPAIEAPLGGAHSRVSRQRKRKEPEVVDERTARLQKRMVKNRESAARSRARKQEYTAQLEVQVAKLREENRILLEKIVNQCPPGAKALGLAEPLRRTRTMPTPMIDRLAE